MDWKKQLDRCFGDADRRFAGQPSDVRTAYELLGVLIEKNISMAEVEREVQNLLRNNPHLHSDEQVKIVRSYYVAWLDG